MRAAGPLMPAETWQAQQRAAETDPRRLLEALDIDPARLDVDPDNAFPMRVPAAFVAAMRPGDADDPLLRQVLPLRQESLPAAPGFVTDPLAEAAQQPLPGLLRKYAGRALLITTGACAIHCRYCFRRHHPYSEAAASGRALGDALDAIAADPSLGEVILSGGDPLSLSDARIDALVTRLESIPQLHTLRLHSRHPVVLPARVTAALCARLAASRLRSVVVIHANHAAELGDEAAAALGRLRAAGALLLNQSVLLAGVNDEVGILAALSQRLLECGVLPYYLHLLDPVAGAAHFDVPLERARALHGELHARLPGYLLPRLVREVPGAAGKLNQETAAL